MIGKSISNPQKMESISVRRTNIQDIDGWGGLMRPPTFAAYKWLFVLLIGGWSSIFVGVY